MDPPVIWCHGYAPIIWNYGWFLEGSILVNLVYKFSGVLLWWCMLTSPPSSERCCNHIPSNIFSIPRLFELRQVKTCLMPFNPSLAEHDMLCLSKQCRSRSVGFWRSALFVIKYQQLESSNLIGSKLEMGRASSTYRGLHTVFTLSIRTPQHLTILVLTF